MKPEACATQADAALPVIRRMDADVGAAERVKLLSIARQIAQEDPRLEALHVFGDRVHSGIAETPWLVIGDTREIALARPGQELAYEYRLSLLARPGDAVVFSAPAHAAFEHYRSAVLGITDVGSIHARPSREKPLLPLAERCLADSDALGRIIEIARAAKALTILPHIAMGSVWKLASAVARATGLDICVAGPPPRLTRFVNDKLWFANLVERTLGREALPPTFSAHGPAALAWRMKALAQSGERIVVKVPDSAGSAGNICLRASDVCHASLGHIREQILMTLRALGWQTTFPLLVGLWEAPVISSPSVQLWIPSRGQGDPVIEGVFEQLLEGTAATFVGSVPADLPKPWQGRLAVDALQLAIVLQHCGYFGRCSFDALLVGRTHAEAKLHWIECNGRWGGVSIPMTLVNRISGPPGMSFVVTQQTEMVRTPRRLSEALDLLGGLLLRPGYSEQGIIVLSPVEIEAGTGAQWIACAQSTRAALALADQAARRLGL